MEAGADGDVEARVETRGDIVGRQPVGDDQREGADVGLGVPSAGVSPAIGGIDPVDDFPEEPDLVTPGGLDPSLGDPANPGEEAGDPEDVGRPAFEEVRELPGLGLTGDESPPVPPSRQAEGVGPGADVQDSGASRAVESLVAGEGQQVDRAWPSGRSGTRPADWAASTRNKAPWPGGRSGRSPRSAGPSPGRSRRAKAPPVEVSWRNRQPDGFRVDDTPPPFRAGSRRSLHFSRAGEVDD